MWAWISENISALVAAFLGLVGLFLSLFGVKVKGINSPATNSNSKGAMALKVALEMLPNFITFSESINRGAAGEDKESFVMTYIESVYNARGVEFTDEDRETIKKHIASIVKATKVMHTDGEKANEKDRRYDIDGVTGLRTIASK